jgi:hypothetical protein
MKTLRPVEMAWMASLAVLALSGSIASGQLSSGTPAGVNAALTRLFGSTTAFTAAVEARVLDPSGQELLRMPMGFAELDGKLRLEIDVGKIHSANLSAKQVAAIRDAGLAQMVTLIRPDRKSSYILYPAVQNYTVMSMSREEADAAGSKLKLEKTALGKTTVDGHSCVQNRSLVKDGAKVILDATTWNATDLRDFPIRIETKDQGNTSILQFRKLQFTRPDSNLFEIPPRYQRAGWSVKTGPGK